MSILNEMDLLIEVDEEEQEVKDVDTKEDKEPTNIKPNSEKTIKLIKCMDNMTDVVNFMAELVNHTDGKVQELAWDIEKKLRDLLPDVAELKEVLFQKD